ncbi:Predicted arabinose efflux permease, MFS family [Tistlia consotensis]|uniref:Predicted arabinose efflux permease, MFS family n=1 Tax=Tistlia consotensis USBA 355 TaxID=560819 RepID=A0A1Y6BKF9_9PROT|nr:MFS transporter [Tistlia consotensis]SMF16298.1 Predicted arabinose efflux permease, MFS family [Tistlia consotensis USBA 355]SNR41240.1 Predicted arabinose efflux permease, MFS family [Tistlia consotensis]
MLFVLLSGIAFMVMGHGLQTSLLGVRAGFEGFPDYAIGLIQSAFYVGFVAGTLSGPWFVRRVGHIRTFAAFASLASMSTVLHAVVVDPWSWLVLRAVTGAALAGTFMVSEAWLNAIATTASRGRILSLYTLVSLVAYGASQLFLTLAKPQSFELFVLVSILISASLIPLSVSKIDNPPTISVNRLGLGRLYRTSPLGAFGAFMAGVVLAAFYGLGAVFVQRLGYSGDQVALFMTVSILGAAVVQWPIGALSDWLDRRSVTAATCLAAAVAALAIAHLVGDRMQPLLVAGFLFGGLTGPIYALCVAHANDYIDSSDAVGAASSLLTLYGIGAAVGPFVGGTIMGQLGPDRLFDFLGVCCASIFAFALWRMTQRAAVPNAEQSAFVAVASTAATPVASELDPRADDEAGEAGDPPVEPAAPGLDEAGEERR